MSTQKKTFKTILNNTSSLIKKRGYQIRESILKPDITMFEFILHCTVAGDDVSFYSCNCVKFNVRLAEKLVNICNEHKCVHIVLIYNGTITGFAKKVLQRCVELTVELFSRSEMMFDITSHVLQPKRFTKTTLNDNFTNFLPLMKETDPIARYFFFTVGDIIEIERRDGTIGYRRVV
jgi:DNA-directed RNA polymerase subunit H (RpoH/RPB5)